VNPYDPARCCPKCGSAHVSTRFYAAVGVIRDEHIRRECSRCRYEWREAPLDARINLDRAQIERLNTAAHAGVTAFPTPKEAT